jgi:hypothetical protein
MRGRRQERVLDGVLGSGEVAAPASERAEDLRRELAQQVIDIGGDVQRSPRAVCRYPSISAALDGVWSITCRT